MSTRWPIVRLGEVLTERREAPLPESLTSGRIKIVSKISFDSGQIQIRLDSETRTGMILIHPGDLVVSGINTAKGAIAVYSRENTEPVAATIHYGAYIPDSTRVNVDFLWWMLRSRFFRDLLDEYLPGGIKTELKATRLLPIPVPLPPLDEQRRILAWIEELSAQIIEAKALRQSAIEETEALISSVSARLFEPKSGWQIMPVGQFCEPPQYGYTESATEEPIGPRFLRITDIQDGKVDWSCVPYCQCDDPSKYVLKPGDLVFARTGATTGKSFVIRDCPEAVFASYLIRLRVRQAVSVDYLYHYFQSPGYWEQITDEKKGTGQPNLNGSKLRRIKVPVPPLDVQQQIVTELEAMQRNVDTLRGLQAETAAELDALMPSILDRAFKGEL